MFYIRRQAAATTPVRFLCRPALLRLPAIRGSGKRRFHGLDALPIAFAAA
jgi:hypothetical protein